MTVRKRDLGDIGQGHGGGIAMEIQQRVHECFGVGVDTDVTAGEAFAIQALAFYAGVAAGVEQASVGMPDWV